MEFLGKTGKSSFDFASKLSDPHVTLRGSQKNLNEGHDETRYRGAGQSSGAPTRPSVHPSSIAGNSVKASTPSLRQNLRQKGQTTELSRNLHPQHRISPGRQPQ
jgi:hypothetical protein